MLLINICSFSVQMVKLSNFTMTTKIICINFKTNFNFALDFKCKRINVWEWKNNAKKKSRLQDNHGFKYTIHNIVTIHFNYMSLFDFFLFRKKENEMNIFTFFYISRKKYWFCANFRFPVFDGFTRFGMSWTLFDYFWKIFVFL